MTEEELKENYPQLYNLLVDTERDNIPLFIYIPGKNIAIRNDIDSELLDKAYVAVEG